MENSEIKAQESLLQKKEKKSFANFVKKNPVLTMGLIGLLSVIVVYFWKNMQHNKETANIKRMASAQLIQSNTEMLTVLSKPLIWSIRSEMLSGNLEKVNIYVKDIVKEKNFQLLQVIDTNGKIILSTNKKVEGKNAENFYDSIVLNVSALKIKNTENNSLLMSAPIMGYDKKLGVLVIEYKPTPFHTENSEKQK